MDWPDFASVVAYAFHWQPSELERKTFHELVTVWYPRAVDIVSDMETQRTNGMLAVIAGAFNGRK